MIVFDSYGILYRIIKLPIILKMDMDNVNGSLEDEFATVGTGSPTIDAGDPDTIYSRFDCFDNERSDLTIGVIGR